MTKQEFLDVVSNGGSGVLKKVLSLLKRTHTDYCIIGGLAVNAYAEPVVSLDLDIVVVAKFLEPFLREASEEFTISTFAHSIILTANLLVKQKVKPIS